MPIETIQRIINDKPNSYEKGSSGNRFKLYFDTAEDLESQIDELKEKGLWEDE